MTSYWAPGVQLNISPAVAGDLIVGRADGNFDRLAIGANGSFLNVSTGTIRWGNTIDTGGLTVTAGGIGAGLAPILNAGVAAAFSVNPGNYVLWTFTGGQANSRRWGIRVDQVVFGDFAIVTESTQGSGTLNTTRLTIDNTGRLTVVAGGLSLFGMTTTYNNIATAGWGTPSIYGYGRPAAGQTAAVASVAAYTNGAADGSFIVSANVLVTTSTAFSFTVTVAYTDESNTPRTLNLTFSQLTGTLLTTITNITGGGAYEGVPLHIRALASTAITIATTGTFTTVVYNVEGAITQIA